MASRWYTQGEHWSSLDSLPILQLAMFRAEALTARTTRLRATESGTMWLARDSGFVSKCSQKDPQVENSLLCVCFFVKFSFVGEIELLGGPTELGGAIVEGNVYIDGNPV